MRGTIPGPGAMTALSAADRPPPTGAPTRPIVVGDKLRGALLDSRQRWRDLVGMAADLAFETDALGHLAGSRGVGIDITAQDAREAQVAAALRRGEVLDHILSRIGQEVLAPRMMLAALDALVNALGAEGAAVI